ncbi:MAG: metallophosphoesterase family protein [Candidatus Omnitrophota bacterium]|nr:metallophosphoesterase family protein [Candidatus Omnitrophota bacterium]
MRYGIFSDVHSNLPALEAVIAAFQKEAIDQYICIGDIVGYAANPKECITRIRELRPVLVAGNHDWACVDMIGTRELNPAAQEAVNWTKQQLSVEEKDFLKSLELLIDDDKFTLVHGTLDNPEDFNYLSDQLDAQVNFELLSGHLCFIGHTHVPGIFIGQDNHTEYMQRYPLQLSYQSKYIVNTGSVGQPRDRDPRASYCIFDCANQTIEIKRVDYDIKEAQKRIVAAGLPIFLSERLALGR